MKTRIFAILSALLVFAGVSSTALAIPLVFPNRVLFNAALGGAAVVENFDALADGTLITTLNGVTYTPSTGTAIVTNDFIPLSPPNGLGRTGLNFFDAGDSITFTFANAISAFGISINTFATANGAYQILFGGNAAASFYDPFPGFATGQFVGFTDSASYSSVTLRGLQGFAYTLDNLTWRVAVPEPSTLALFAFGLLGMGVLTRRRRTN